MSRYIQLTIRLDDEGIDVASNSEHQLYKRSKEGGYSDYLLGEGTAINLLPNPGAESTAPSLNATVIELEALSNRDGASLEVDAQERRMQERMK